MEDKGKEQSGFDSFQIVTLGGRKRNTITDNKTTLLLDFLRNIMRQRQKDNLSILPLLCQKGNTHTHTHSVMQDLQC